MRNARRPVISAAMSVLPLPPKRSRTCWPSLDEYSMARLASSTYASASIEIGNAFASARRVVPSGCGIRMPDALVS